MNMTKTQARAALEEINSSKTGQKLDEYLSGFATGELTRAEFILRVSCLMENAYEDSLNGVPAESEELNPASVRGREAS